MGEVKKAEYQLIFNGIGSQDDSGMTRLTDLFSKEFGLSDTAVELFLKKAPMAIKHASTKEELTPFFEKLVAAGADVLLKEPNSPVTYEEEFTIELDEPSAPDDSIELKEEDNLTIEQLVNELEASTVALKPTHTVEEISTPTKIEAKAVEPSLVKNDLAFNLELGAVEAEPEAKSSKSESSAIEFDLALAPEIKENEEQKHTPAQLSQAESLDQSHEASSLSESLELSPEILAPEVPAAPQIKETEIIQLETAKIEHSPTIAPMQNAETKELPIVTAEQAPVEKAPVQPIEIGLSSAISARSSEQRDSSISDSSAVLQNRTHKRSSNLGFYLATIGSIALLGVANWFYFSDSQVADTVKIDTSALLKEASNKKSSKKTSSEESLTKLNETPKTPATTWIAAMDKNLAPIEAKIETVANAMSSVSITLSQSATPELTPLEIVHKVKRAPWISKALLDNATFFTASDGSMHAQGVAKVTIAYDERSFPTSADAEIAATQTADKLTVVVTLKRLLAPGENPNGSLIEALPNGGFKLFHRVEFVADKKAPEVSVTPEAAKIESKVSDEELKELLQ